MLQIGHLFQVSLLPSTNTTFLERSVATSGEIGHSTSEALVTPSIAAFFPISARLLQCTFHMNLLLDFNDVEGLSKLVTSALTSLFTDEVAVDGITLDSGPVGHGSLPSARLKCCSKDIMHARLSTRAKKS